MPTNTKGHPPDPTPDEPDPNPMLDCLVCFIDGTKFPVVFNDRAALQDWFAPLKPSSLITMELPGGKQVHYPYHAFLRIEESAMKRVVLELPVHVVDEATPPAARVVPAPRSRRSPKKSQ